MDDSAELHFLCNFDMRATGPWKQAVVECCPPCALPPSLAQSGFAWLVQDKEHLGAEWEGIQQMACCVGQVKFLSLCSPLLTIIPPLSNHLPGFHQCSGLFNQQFIIIPSSLRLFHSCLPVHYFIPPLFHHYSVHRFFTINPPLFPIVHRWSPLWGHHSITIL